MMASICVSLFLFAACPVNAAGLSTDDTKKLKESCEAFLGTFSSKEQVDKKKKMYKKRAQQKSEDSGYMSKRAALGVIFFTWMSDNQSSLKKPSQKTDPGYSKMCEFCILICLVIEEKAPMSPFFVNSLLSTKRGPRNIDMFCDWLVERAWLGR